MKTVYRVVSNVLKGWQDKPDDYVLQVNEIIGPKVLKPFWNGTDIVESFTQADQDIIDDGLLDTTVAQLLAKFETDGQAFFKKVAVRTQRAYNDGDLNDNQLATAKTAIKIHLQPLKDGDWDVAKVNIEGVSRPGGALGVLYDFILDGLTAYLA